MYKRCLNVLHVKANLQFFRLSIFHKKLESIVWCPYLDQCLSKLEESRDPSDELLISQVRLQHVMRKTAEAYVQLIRDGTPSQPGNSALIMLHIKTLKLQLADVTNRIPSHLADIRM